MMAAPACRLSCRCCTEQSGRHPCSVDRRSVKEPCALEALAAAGAWAGGGSECLSVVVQSSKVKQNQYLRLLSTFLLGIRSNHETGCMDRMIAGSGACAMWPARTRDLPSIYK